MPALTEPTMRVHASFLQALHEYRAEGRYGHLDPEHLEHESIFRRYLDKLRADAVLRTRRMCWTKSWPSTNSRPDRLHR
jgi:hypothetical protein